MANFVSIDACNFELCSELERCNLLQMQPTGKTGCEDMVTLMCRLYVRNGSLYTRLPFGIVGEHTRRSSLVPATRRYPPGKNEEHEKNF